MVREAAPPPTGRRQRSTPPASRPTARSQGGAGGGSRRGVRPRHPAVSKAGSGLGQSPAARRYRLAHLAERAPARRAGRSCGRCRRRPPPGAARCGTWTWGMVCPVASPLFDADGPSRRRRAPRVPAARAPTAREERLGRAGCQLLEQRPRAARDHDDVAVARRLDARKRRRRARAGRPRPGSRPDTMRQKMHAMSES